MPRTLLNQADGLKRSLPTILILLAMVLISAMYWLDMSYYTDPDTKFIIRGTVWMRYAILALPLLMGLMGLRTVGPRAIGLLRMRSRLLAGLFVVGSVAGFVYGAALVLLSLNPLDEYRAILGAVMLWYSGWMICCTIQLATQATPSPTRSAVWGILAAVPFCMLTIYRVLVKPTGLARIAPLVQVLTSLVTMLWFAMLLRAFYIALTRRRARWMYLFGIYTFLLGTCLEMPQTIHAALYGGVTLLQLLEAIHMGAIGIVAGGVSVALAGRSESAFEPTAPEPPQEDLVRKSIVYKK